MWILVHNIFVALLVQIWNCHFLAIFSTSRFCYSCLTEMLCTKIFLYIKFPVDLDGIWCHNEDIDMIYLSSKIFHESLLVNLLVKFQTGFGDPRPQPIWFFWPISIRTKILAPESALGAKHFKSCVILGHPNHFKDISMATILFRSSSV